MLNNFVYINWTCHKRLAIKYRYRLGGWHYITQIFWTATALLQFRKFPQANLNVWNRLYCMKNLVPNVWLLLQVCKYECWLSLFQLGACSVFGLFIAASFCYWILMPSRSATSQTACTFRSRLGTAGAHSSPQPGRAGCRNRADPGPERAPQPGPTTHGHRHSHAVGAARGAHANPLLLRFLPAAWLSKQDETAGTAGVVVRAHQRHSGSRSPSWTRPAQEDPGPQTHYSAGPRAKTPLLPAPRGSMARPPRAGVPAPGPLRSERPSPSPARRRAPSPAPPHAGARRPRTSPSAPGAPAGAERPSEGAWPPAPTHARALRPYGYVSGHVTPSPKVPREATGR